MPITLPLMCFGKWECEELNDLNYGRKLSTYTQIPVFSCIPCSSFYVYSMRYSMSIPCAVPCAYKESLYAESQMDIPGSFQAMPGAASIISNSHDSYIFNANISESPRRCP